MTEYQLESLLKRGAANFIEDRTIMKDNNMTANELWLAVARAKLAGIPVIYAYGKLYLAGNKTEFEEGLKAERTQAMAEGIIEYR